MFNENMSKNRSIRATLLLIIMQRTILLLFAIFSLYLQTSTGYAEIPTELEPDYAEAILALNAKHYDRAIEFLNQLLKKSPKVPEALELKALALKYTEDVKESEATYNQLLQIQSAAGASESLLAPYHFELGMIAFKKNDTDQTIFHLKKCFAADFNRGVSAFFLGMVYFKKENWDYAGTAFRWVLKGETQELKPPSHFYLAQIFFKINYASAATDQLELAKSLAKSLIERPETTDANRKILSQIYEASTKALEPLDQPRWFGSVSLQSAYETNVLSLPPTTPDSQATGKKTLKETLSAGLGYMTSPIGLIQLTPSYRGSFNLNTNTQSKSAEYISNTGSLYATYRALAPNNFGLKAEGTFTHQNQAATEGTNIKRFTFEHLSTEWAAGPYFKTDLARRLTLGGECFASLTTYPDDTKATSDNKKSGISYLPRVYIKRDTGSRFLNPTFSINYKLARADGSKYQNYLYGASLSNEFNFGKLTSSTASISLSKTTYNKRSPVKKDTLLTVYSSLNRKINSRISAAAEITFSKNSSNSADSKYSKWIFALGASYSLF